MTDNPAKAPEPDMRPSRVYAREALAAELAEENFAVPAQVGEPVPVCPFETMEWGCAEDAPLTDAPAAQPVSAPSPELPSQNDYRFKTSEEAELLPLPLQILRLKEINAGLCNDHNTLVIMNARESEARKQEAVEQFNAGIEAAAKECDQFVEAYSFWTPYPDGYAYSDVESKAAALFAKGRFEVAARKIRELEPVSGSPERLEEPGK